MQHRQQYDDEDDNDSILKDGERLHVSMTMVDSTQRDAAARRQKITVRNKAGCPLVVDSIGETQGLQRPGWRLAGGRQRDQLLRDGTYEDCEAAHAAYRDQLTGAWKNPSPYGARHSNDKIGDDEVNDRCATIRKALRQRGYDQNEIKKYLLDLDDDDALDNDVDAHVEVFEREYGGRRADAVAIARDHRDRMDRLIAERDRELQDEWSSQK